jgi:hypothetical protein
MAPPFLISVLDGGECSSSGPGRFNPGEIAPGVHWIGDWVKMKELLYIFDRISIKITPAKEEQLLKSDTKKYREKKYSRRWEKRLHYPFTKK